MPLCPRNFKSKRNFVCITNSVPLSPLVNKDEQVLDFATVFQKMTLFSATKYV